MKIKYISKGKIYVADMNEEAYTQQCTSWYVVQGLVLYRAFKGSEVSTDRIVPVPVCCVSTVTWKTAWLREECSFMSVRPAARRRAPVASSRAISRADLHTTDVISGM